MVCVCVCVCVMSAENVQINLLLKLFGNMHGGNVSEECDRKAEDCRA